MSGTSPSIAEQRCWRVWSSKLREARHWKARATHGRAGGRATAAPRGEDQRHHAALAAQRSRARALGLRALRGDEA